MPVALFITGMPSASTATLPSAGVSNRPARLPIRNAKGCGLSLELLEKVVGQVERDGGKPLRARISFRRSWAPRVARSCRAIGTRSGPPPRT